MVRRCLNSAKALQCVPRTWLPWRNVDVDREEVLRSQNVLGILVRDACGGDLREDLVRAAVLPHDVSRHQPYSRPA